MASLDRETMSGDYDRRRNGAPRNVARQQTNRLVTTRPAASVSKGYFDRRQEWKLPFGCHVNATATEGNSVEPDGTGYSAYLCYIWRIESTPRCRTGEQQVPWP